MHKNNNANCKKATKNKMRSHLNSYATTISRDILNHQIKCLTKKLSPRIIGFIGLNKSFLNPFFKLIKLKLTLVAEMDHHQGSQFRQQYH